MQKNTSAEADCEVENLEVANSPTCLIKRPVDAANSLTHVNVSWNETWHNAGLADEKVQWYACSCCITPYFRGDKRRRQCDNAKGFRTRSGGTRLIGPKTRKQRGQHLPEDGGEMGSTRIMVEKDKITETMSKFGRLLVCVCVCMHKLGCHKNFTVSQSKGTACGD